MLDMDASFKKESSLVADALVAHQTWLLLLSWDQEEAPQGHNRDTGLALPIRVFCVWPLLSSSSLR